MSAKIRHMKMMLLLLLLCFQSYASTWDDYLAEKKATISHQSHLPYRLYHGRKTETSVLIIHGIYSSPLYFKGFADAFYEHGYNVVTILLPGHWDKDAHSIEKVTNEDWIKEVDRGFQLAKAVGKKVILGGHSLGGLLSFEQAIKRDPSEVKAIVALSPSLKVWPVVLSAINTWGKLGLYGNDLMSDATPNGVDIPLYAPIAGAQIQSLAKTVTSKPQPKTPIFVAYTKRDQVVDVPFLAKYLENYPGAKRIKVFDIKSKITHGCIFRSPRDIPNFKNAVNPQFDPMMVDALDFLDTVQ